MEPANPCSPCHPKPSIHITIIHPSRAQLSHHHRHHHRLARPDHHGSSISESRTTVLIHHHRDLTAAPITASPSSSLRRCPRACPRCCLLAVDHRATTSSAAQEPVLDPPSSLITEAGFSTIDEPRSTSASPSPNSTCCRPSQISPAVHFSAVVPPLMPSPSPFFHSRAQIDTSLDPLPCHRQH
jgi:hypothetical protein